MAVAVRTGGLAKRRLFLCGHLFELNKSALETVHIADTMSSLRSLDHKHNVCSSQGLTESSACHRCMYCVRSGLCATRTGHLTISCTPALRAPVVEVQTAQPRSRLPMIFDGWFRRYASLNLERFDFSRLAVVPNLLLVCYTNL